MQTAAVFERTPTVSGLIRYAYGLASYDQVVGPDWIRREWYQVTAQAAGEVSVDQMRLMLRSLLADGFSLVFHSEQRTMAHFAMVTTRSDRMPGPYLLPVPDNCDPDAIAEVEKRFPPRGRAAASAQVITVRCESASAIADMAMRGIGAPVIDRTGLTGKWAFQVLLPVIRNGPADTDWMRGATATALREQLGVKLERTRGPVDVIVVDSVKRPRQN